VETIHVLKGGLLYWRDKTVSGVFCMFAEKEFDMSVSVVTRLGLFACKLAALAGLAFGLALRLELRLMLLFVFASLES
jgi:hypothetical protein